MIVAIRKSARTVNPLLRTTSHTNLVNITNIFNQRGVMHLVYEPIKIALSDICSFITLREPDISYICKEILYGLVYIDRELGASSIDLTPDNIFVNDHGDVKIGNIGASLIVGRTNKMRDNIRCLGFLMMELMEPQTAASKPDLIVLMCPEAWSWDIRDFQSMTQRQCFIEELFIHTFLVYGYTRHSGRLASMVTKAVEQVDKA